MKSYLQFLQSKMKIAEKTGFTPELPISDILKPHQKDLVKWAIEGGRRGIFASFGLGKTIMQLELMKHCHYHTKKPVLFVCPLGVKLEFQKDAIKLLKLPAPKYITSSDEITEDYNYYITNYERIRMGSIDPSAFGAVTFDEASILRGLATETVDVIMHTFKSIPYRFVFTATPSPNRFLELTHYADYLGVMDRGLCLTTFFQRDSTTAGNLTLLERRKKEFWYWMSSWSTFITKPSDLGYDNTGYDLPPIKIHRHLVQFDREVVVDKFTAQASFVPESTRSLSAASKEKRVSLPYRVDKMKEIIAENSEDNILIWHHLEAERHAIQEVLGKDCKSVWGSQNIEEREENLIGFSEGKYKYLSTKPEIAGSGCNFQYHCHKAIFVGIDYKFNDFIQAVHRIYRFLQSEQVEIHIIYTDAEEDILKKLEEKWSNHLTLQSEMTTILQEYGLNADIYKKQLTREFFENRQEVKTENWHSINNDSILELPRIESDSIGHIVTSIPFGNHYEYSENYNCLGHNPSNEDFWKQMDFMIPELYRVLKPGRIAAIHVKDRIRFSYQNGDGFTDLLPFSDETTTAMRKHGFNFVSRITITTDVVRENNQTYRLGWTEKCKDGTKMGNGLPEYLLIFRKPPSDTSNSYADEPVVHSKEEYTRGRWQLDAHAYWKSNGDTLFDTETLKKMDLSDILKVWKMIEQEEVYDYHKHVELCEKLDGLEKLPTSFMAIPPQAPPDSAVWDDISRMNTLNSTQARKNLVKHICPLQLDIIERSIERWSNKDDIVLDPFGGLASTAVQALKMGRKATVIELNVNYWKDGLTHLKIADVQNNQVELFQ